ncbi:MAG TPA: hypothetical protein VHT92_11850 [Candidatus Cybelea sp.]|jgi:hypothetical protein|nr:hypothetical protein [Candidatus Cybelea sp.]
MKQRLFGIVLVAVCAFATRPVAAGSDALTSWFTQATAYHTGGNAFKMSKPEQLPGKPASMNCHDEEGRPNFAGVWQLLKYDRIHHIAFATATTDQCSVALFRAPAPAVSVPDADLSAYSTRLGVRIGTSYATVRSIYGAGPEKSARHFVVIYSSNVPGETVALPKKKVDLPQDVTIVVDSQRVSAISIYTDMAPEF